MYSLMIIKKYKYEDKFNQMNFYARDINDIILSMIFLKK